PLARAIPSKEREGGRAGIALDRRSPAGSRLDGDEFGLGANPSRRERGLDRGGERVRLQIRRERSPRERAHARAPSTRPNGVAGSRGHASILRPAAANSAATLSRSYFVLISVRMDSPAARVVGSSPGISTTWGRVETRCISIRCATVS